MSALRLGRNPDGTREIRILEPQTAKRQGWGGSALGHFSGTTLTVKQQLHNRPGKRLPRQPLNRARCGLPVHVSKEACARTPGHGGRHASSDAVARLNERRRSA